MNSNEKKNINDAFLCIYGNIADSDPFHLRLPDPSPAL